jgi:hypothetical protein
LHRRLIARIIEPREGICFTLRAGSFVDLNAYRLNACRLDGLGGLTIFSVSFVLGTVLLPLLLLGPAPPVQLNDQLEPADQILIGLARDWAWRAYRSAALACVPTTATNAHAAFSDMGVIPYVGASGLLSRTGGVSSLGLLSGFFDTVTLPVSVSILTWPWASA